MERHGDAGLHAAVNVRHQPANCILYDEKRDDEPVEQLGDGAVLRTVSHEIPWGQSIINDMTTIRVMPALFHSSKQKSRI
jgi:hypothetical protein